MRKLILRLAILPLALGPVACSDAQPEATQLAQTPPGPPPDIQRRMIEQKKKLSAKAAAPQTTRRSLRVRP